MGLEEVALQGPLGPQRMYSRLEVILVKGLCVLGFGSVRSDTRGNSREPVLGQ